MNALIRNGSVALVAALVALSGCAKNTSTTDTAAASASSAASAGVSPAPDAGLATADDVSATPATTTPALAPTSASPATSAPSTTPAPPAFTDISGINGQREIVELAQLGAVDPVAGAFHPADPVKRRDFIRWLVKSNNALWSDVPARRIALADTTESSAFHDIATTDPDFRYVQGMQDAGYSVGFPDHTFKPDAPLTREQMFAIKNTFDRGSVDPGLVKGVDFARNTVMPPWKDKASISKTYVPAIASGANGGADAFALVYGSSSLFHPQLPVTRAQAALAVSTVGDHQFYGGARRTAASALTATPSPS